jgi:hypothetical protein
MGIKMQGKHQIRIVLVWVPAPMDNLVGAVRCKENIAFNTLTKTPNLSERAEDITCLQKCFSF